MEILDTEYAAVYNSRKQLIDEAMKFVVKLFKDKPITTPTGTFPGFLAGCYLYERYSIKGRKKHLAGVNKIIKEKFGPELTLIVDSLSFDFQDTMTDDLLKNYITTKYNTDERE